MSRDGPRGELFRCSGCYVWDYLDDYKTNRLGFRLKTCLRCVAREKNPGRIASRIASRNARAATRANTDQILPQTLNLTDVDVEDIISGIL